MAAPSNDSLARKTMVIAGVVALYWFVSIAMVFLNKHLLSGVSMDAPIFVTWFQCVVAVVFCFVAGAMRDVHPSMKAFPKFEYRLEVARQVLPLSIVFVCMIAFNNLCLKFVGVAFYNVGRSLTTVFNVIFTYWYLGETTSMNALFFCAMIILGFFLGVDQEKSGGELSILGVLYGILASLAVALNAIFTKRTMAVVDKDTWRLTAYNNLNALILFVPVMLVLGEGPRIVGSPDLVSAAFWGMMTLAGLFGIAIGTATMLQIEVTSPLTHNISGTAKACAQTILALQLSGQVKSAMWWLSNAMVLGGSMGYTMVRRAEMIKADEAAKARAPIPETKV